MTRYSSAVVALLVGIISNEVKAHGDGGEGFPITDNDASRFRPKSKISFEKTDDGCDYTYSFSFKHDATLPVPDDPQKQCDPTSDPPVFANDGLPYLPGREHIFMLSNKIKKATGFNHISLDFLPCGHPPFGTFTQPHYDFHVYTDSVEERSKRTCTLQEGAPVCALEQDTIAGRKFFHSPVDNVSGKYANMPDGFVCMPGDNVPGSGAHCWDIENQPSPENPWEEPVLIMGTYDSKVVFFEPMAPLSFVTGNKSNKYVEDVTYIAQTIESFPYKYEVHYNKNDGRTTIVFHGKSMLCRDKWFY